MQRGMSNASIAQGSLVYVAPRPCTLPQPAILSCRYGIFARINLSSVSAHQRQGQKLAATN